MKIGFIGTGVMGSRMVKRLIKAGHQVNIYTRSPEKARALVELGAQRTLDIPTLARGSDVICTCLSMPNDTTEVYLGPQGVINHARPNSICIDFTTVGADTSKNIFSRAKEQGISYLDAPVSGGPEGAEQGTLTIMVGGSKSTFEAVDSILNELGSLIQYLGEAGSGSIAKLINQYLVAVHSLAASEAMVTAVAHGLDPEQLYQILQVSYGDSKMLRRQIGQFVLSRNFEPGGAVKYLHKDVKIANTLVEQAGVSQFTGRLAEEALAKAIKGGLENLDMSAVIQPLEEECQVVVKRKIEGLTR